MIRLSVPVVISSEGIRKERKNLFPLICTPPDQEGGIAVLPPGTVQKDASFHDSRRMENRIDQLRKRLFPGLVRRNFQMKIFGDQFDLPQMILLCLEGFLTKKPSAADRSGQDPLICPDRQLIHFLPFFQLFPVKAHSVTSP